MLILNTSDVEYCQVNHFQGKEIKTLLGLNYRGLLFIKSRTYAKTQLKNAIDRCRHFLDLEIPVTSIVLTEDSCISVWFEHKKVKLVKTDENKAIKSLTKKLEMATQ